MNRLIRWYNKNREQVIISIAIIAFVLTIIYTLNTIIGRKNEEKINNTIALNSSTNNSTTISKTQESIITGDMISTENNNINTKLIKQFVDFCNNGEIEKAYNMLSKECKSLFYPNIEYFKKNYYDKIFSIKRMYNLENWFNTSSLCTYYIKYSEDILDTGTTKSSNNKSDYITVLKEESGYYLNINNYVGRRIRNHIVTQDNIIFKINYEDFYINYTVLNISVTNNTKNVICIDTKESANSTYLYDENNVKYTAFLNENAKELIVKRKVTNDINIKFNKLYNPSRTSYGITFNDIVLNYEDYEKGESKKVITSIDIRI